MKKKKLKWYFLFILFLLCLFIIPTTFSKYAKSFNRKITINVRKPQYQIAFNANPPLGRTVSGSMQNQQFTYGTAQNLNSNNFTITNCVFKGWNTKANGSGTSYTDGQSVNNLSSTDGYIINLYAQWDIYYDVTFDSDGGSSVASQTVLENTNATKPADPTKTHYIFKGWQLNGADYNFTTSVTGDITLKAKWEGISTVMTGANLSTKMKNLAGNSSASSTSEDKNIKIIKKATEAEYEAIKNSLTSTNEIQIDGLKTYMWYNNNTIYCYSLADTVYMNADSGNAFRKMTELADISGLSIFDTSNVTDMNRMFLDSVKISSLSSLENWDVSNVKNMNYMFGANYTSSTAPKMAFSDLTPLSNWDVSSVENMDSMFKMTNVSSVEPIKNWDVSKVTTFKQMFNRANLTTATSLSIWDPASATTFEMMLANMGMSTSNMPIFTTRPGTWATNGTYTTTN